jgi:hypothetical protein
LDLNSETTKHGRSFRLSIIPQQITDPRPQATPDEILVKTDIGERPELMSLVTAR